MTYFSLSALINALVFLLFGLYVYFHNPIGKLNKSLVFWCLPGFVWSVFYFFWQVEVDQSLALLWTKLLMLGAIWVPVAYLNIVVIFLDLEKEKKGMVMLGYILAVMFTMLLGTPYLVGSVEPVDGFRFWPKAGTAFWAFLVYFFAVSSYCVALGLGKLKSEDKKKRAQINLMIIGAALSILGGSTNFFLWYDIPIKPFGNILASAYVPLTFYSIIRHRLLEGGTKGKTR